MFSLPAPILALLPDAIWNAVGQLGVLGPVLAWFMWSHDKRIERVVDAMNNLTRAISLEVVTRPNIMERTKREAQDILDQVVQRRA